MIRIIKGKAEKAYHDINFREEEGHKVRHVFIRKDQLLYDIDTETNIISKMRRDDKLGDKLATSETDSFRPLFHRWIDKYMDKAINRLSAFIFTPARVASMDDMDMWKEKELTLIFPMEWDDTTYEQLAGAIHDYIKNGALYEYLILSLTVNDPVTVSISSLKEESYEAIMDYANKKIGGYYKKNLEPMHF